MDTVFAVANAGMVPFMAVSFGLLLRAVLYEHIR